MTNSPTEIPRTSEGIGAWLRERVSHYLEQPTETIDPNASLAIYGLDSIYAFALIAEIEDVLDLQIEPTLIWDVNTLGALTDHLVELATG